MKNTLRYKPKFEENPFTKTKKNPDPPKPLINTSNLNTNKPQSSKNITTYSLLNDEQFLNYYTDKLKNLLNLDNKSTALVKYIISELHPNKNYIDLNLISLKSNTQYASLGSIYAALNNLVEIQILARTTIERRFFINLDYIFRVDSISFTEVIEREKNIRIKDKGEYLIRNQRRVVPEGFDDTDKI